MATVVRGYKTELDLNKAQRAACLKHAGCARFAFNWGLAGSQEVYRTNGRRPTVIDLHKELVTLKKTVYPWMYEVSKCAVQEALRDLDTALQHFFRKVALKKAGQFRGKLGFPKFKKKSRAVSSFRFPGGKKIHVFADAIQLPRLGRLRLHEHGYLPTNAKVLSATVSDRAGRWYVSVQLVYKADWHSTHLVVIDRFYPSSKICSGCGWTDENLNLLVRTFVCERCGMRLDRDVNAAVNIVAVGLIDKENACGQGSAGMLDVARETALDEAGTKLDRVARLPMTTF